VRSPLNRLLAFCAVWLLGGCSQDAMLEKLASEEDRRLATECIDTLRQGRIGEIEARLDPSIRTPEVRATLAQMVELLPKGEPSAKKLVGVQLDTRGDVRDANLTYQYSYGERHFLINCALRTTGTDRVIFGLNVHSLDASIEQQQKFELAGKTPLHYLVLFAIVAAPVLSLVALIQCFKEKDLRRKWLWVLFILFGIGQFALDWNTGAWTFRPVHLQLFSAGTYSTGYGGWQLLVALPLGAIVYLVRRYRNHRAPARSNDAELR
jgi:hypothetical protein